MRPTAYLKKGLKSVIFLVNYEQMKIICKKLKLKNLGNRFFGSYFILKEVIVIKKNALK